MFIFFLLFFCQRYPRLPNCKSVFLILIISQYGRSRWWVQLFQGIRVRIDIRIDIFISVRRMTTKFGEQVHLQDLTQMRLIKQVLYYFKITWQTKNISPLQGTYGHETWQHGNLLWWIPAHKVRWLFHYVVL